MNLLHIDHVQITVPKAREREARRFYGDVLGLREVGRPSAVPGDGLYFAFDEGTQLHVILMENPFRPPMSDHFAVVVDDLEALKGRLAEHNVDYNGRECVFIHDPFGNKLEFLGRTNGDGRG